MSFGTYYYYYCCWFIIEAEEWNFFSFSFSPSRNTVGSENPNTVGGLLSVVIVMNSCNRTVCK
jgi:hypothetical protein